MQIKECNVAVTEMGYQDQLQKQQGPVQNGNARTLPEKLQEFKDGDS